MPPKKFPSQAEREALMEQLKQAAEKDEGLKASAHYQNYIQALGKLNEQLDGYYQPDETGAVSALEQEEKDELMTALAETATLGETFLADAANRGDDLKTGVPDMVGKVQEMLSQDYETLGVYDPKEGEMSLPELQQDARTQVVDLRGVKLGKLGNAQSSRLPMTVVSATGEQRRGVFTKASYVSIKQPFQAMLDKAAEQCRDPETKEKIKNFVPRFRDYLASQDNDARLENGVPVTKATDEQIIGQIYMGLWGQEDDLISEKIDQYMECAGLGSGTLSGAPRRILKEGITAGAESAAPWMNSLKLHLKDGDRLDQRNSAMSAVANLLGVSKLVARSNNMKCIDEDGNVVEGTFMDFAEGVDLMGDNGFKEFARVTDEPFNETGDLNVELADLQVLDYLCGNEDRHAGNMTYKISKSGQIVGLQAIDNDSSFGLVNPMGGLKFYSNGTRWLGVITDGMASKIEKLSPEMLKFTLRGRGLNEKELQAACDRLGSLRSAVQKAKPYGKERGVKPGILTRIRQEDLKKLNIAELGDHMSNTFQNVRSHINRSILEAREAGIHYDSRLGAPEKKPLKQVGTTDRQYTAAGISQSMRGVENLLHNEVTGFEVSSLSKLFRSSDNYRLMVTEMKNAARLAKEIKSEIEAGGKEKLSRDDKAVEEQRNKADEAMARVERANDAYLAKKMLEKGLDPTNPEDIKKLRGKNDYEQKRIDYALKVRASVQEYKRLNAPEAQAEKDAVKQRLEIQHKQPQREQPQAGGPTL